MIKFHGKGAVETIPFPEHLKSRYQEYTQADLTKLRATGYDKPLKLSRKVWLSIWRG